MQKRSLVLLVLGLIFTVIVVPAAYADAPVEGRVGRSELRFLEGMIDHHQMALDMATDCLAKAETETVRTLCQNIIDAQSREILTMRGWLLGWYGITYEPTSMLHAEYEANHPEGASAATDGPANSSEHSSGNHTGNEHDTAVANPVQSDPTMTMGMFAGLNALTGVEYEIAWLEAMIDHHDDAIHMAERILERAPESSGHNEIREIAQNIISDQTAEIEAMEALLTELTP